MVDEVVERIESFLDQDLGDLLDAIERADEALLAAESGPVEQVFEVGALLTLDPEEDQASTDSLRQAWRGVREEVLAHVETERRIVLPGCRHVLNGMSALRVGLRTPLRRMIAEHASLRDALDVVVAEARLVPATTPAFEAVIREWAQHVHVQEAVIFPEAFEEDTDEIESVDWQTRDLEEAAVPAEAEEDDDEPPTLAPTAVPKPAPVRSEPDADDIGARLRASASRNAMAATPEVEEESGGVLGRFRSLWKRK